MTRIVVPATSANFGPGFDCIGAAWTLSNEYEVDRCFDGALLIGSNGENQRADSDNLIIRAMEHAFRFAGFPIPGFKLTVIREDIPRSRGLGSSAAAVSAGLMAANALMSNALDSSTLLQLATDMEGHPDNAAPCLLGGLRVSVVDSDRRVQSVPVTLGGPLHFIAAVPPFSLKTVHSRSVLPNTYCRSDLIHTLSHAALLIAALQGGEWSYLSEALRDVCHQPYRLPLIPDGARVFELCQNHGALGCFLSGAGPTIVGVFSPGVPDLAAMTREGTEQIPGWAIVPLSLYERQGLV